MIDEAAALYAVDPSGFVAARTQLVRELKAAKRKDDAALVAKLPRPRLGEYLLNRVARDHPDVATSFASAVTAATAAQSDAIGKGDGAALRTSSAALRAATSKLVDAAVRTLQGDERDAPGRGDEVRTIVRSLTNETGVAQLVAGIVGSGSQPAADLFAGAPEPHDVPKRASSPKAKAESPPTPEPKPPPVKPSKTDLASARRHQARVATATTALARAERELSAAKRAADAAAARLSEAQSVRDQAAAELDNLGTTP